MNFELSETQEMLRDSLRRFLSERAPIDSYVRPQIDAPVVERDDVWRDLAALGMHGLLVPEAHGGGGLGMVEMGIVCEEMGRALYPAPFAPTALAAVTLLRQATYEAAPALLRSIAAGELVAAVALLEPAGGYDWRSPQVVARFEEAGWRLVGEKAPVPGGLGADAWLVTARDDAGLGLFCVRAGERVHATPLATVDRTTPLASVRFEDAPAVRIVPADAKSLVATAIDRIVVAAVADGLGAAGRAFELAAAYAHERHQFGKPIGSFQAVQHLLVDMLQDLELARAATYYALWAADAALPAEAHRAATMAGAFASRALAELGASAIQIFAGIGYTWEHDVHLFYKRLLTLQHLYGDEGAHLDELADLVLDPPGGSG